MAIPITSGRLRLIAPCQTVSDATENELTTLNQKLTIPRRDTLLPRRVTIMAGNPHGYR
jgi:hypothetical protein